MELKSININKSYNGIEVVKGVSVSLKKGEIVGLLGPNGAGKTTTFDMIVGLISPEEGEVFLNDLKNKYFRRCKIHWLLVLTIIIWAGVATEIRKYRQVH